MLTLFPSEPFQIKRVDPDYARERDAARDAGLGIGLIDLEALIAGDAHAAVARVADGDGSQACIYRGWMVTPERYAALAASLSEIGWPMLTAPDQYRRAHNLPLAYDAIRDATPATVWTTDLPLTRSAIQALVAPFGNQPIVIKDFVKSRKHEWNEAFYMPSAADLDHVEAVTNTFVERQGEDLAGGIVYREFVPLASVGKHPRSGISLSLEYRAFVFQGEILLSTPYWDDAVYPEASLPYDDFLPLVKDISPFLSMDIAQTAQGGWIIVEVGDGQVSGLAENVDVAEFYRRMSLASGR